MIDLKVTLDLHAKWLRKEKGGARADLRGADLAHANLEGANLARADLRGADLAHANLEGANLAHAYLEGANLRGADLGGANLAHAYLEGANLRGADLGGANLRGADLGGANLESAKGILRLGPTLDGFEFFVVRHETGLMFKSGCKWGDETLARAIASDITAPDDIRAERQAFLAFALAWGRGFKAP